MVMEDFHTLSFHNYYRNLPLSSKLLETLVMEDFHNPSFHSCYHILPLS